MAYEVRLRRSAQQGLDDLSGQDYQRVASAISALQQNPRPPRIKKLAESALWRLRVGRYRVVYAIDDVSRVVTIVRVAMRRENTYKGT